MREIKGVKILKASSGEHKGIVAKNESRKWEG